LRGGRRGGEFGSREKLEGKNDGVLIFFHVKEKKKHHNIDPFESRIRGNERKRRVKEKKEMIEDVRARAEFKEHRFSDICKRREAEFAVTNYGKMRRRHIEGERRW